MSFKKILAVVVLISAGLMGKAQAAPVDVAQTYLNISGNVPAFFEIWMRGVPGDLDLSPRVSVHDRLLGIMHVKYNIPIDSLTVKATGGGTTGKPYDAVATADWPGTIVYKAVGSASCKTVGDSAATGNAGTPITLTQGAAAGQLTNAGGVSIHSAETEDLVTNAAALGNAVAAGLEEDCPITADITGVAADLPLAGKYSQKFVFTMTSK